MNPLDDGVDQDDVFTDDRIERIVHDRAQPQNVTRLVTALG
jgi:hypothetical protein